MFYKPLLIPLLIQVANVFIVWVVLYITRISEMKKLDIDPQDLEDSENKRQLLKNVAGPSDNFSNQFEIPVLFYLAIVVALTLMIQNPLLNSLALAFVLLRVVHSLVQITYNQVMHRFIAYALSSAALWAMWVVIGWHILSR